MSEIKTTEKYSVNEAAKRLGMGPESLKEALKKDLFRPQIGIAVPRGATFKYEIFKNRVENYLKGIS